MDYLGMTPVLPDLPSSLVGFLINISSTALALPALIVLGTLANLLE